MPKKILLLIILTFLLCGCEATYNLNITDKKVSETTIINNYDVSSWTNGSPNYKELIDNNYALNLPVNHNIPGYLEDYTKLDGYKYYQKTLINSADNYGMKLEHTFKNSEYIYSSIALETFPEAKITNIDNYLTIDSGSNSPIFDNYSDFTKFKVNITTDYEVKSNNADKQTKNTYTWEFNKTNIKTKKINIVINENKKNTYLIELNDKKVSSNFYKILIVSIIIIILFAIIFISVKVKKSNR